MAKHGDLMFWWIPQAPMKRFEYPVKSVGEALLLYDAFSRYDIFQCANGVKPDFCNVGGLLIWDNFLNEDEDGEKWTEWEYPETFKSLEEIAYERD